MIKFLELLVMIMSAIASIGVLLLLAFAIAYAVGDMLEDWRERRKKP